MQLGFFSNSELPPGPFPRFSEVLAWSELLTARLTVKFP